MELNILAKFYVIGMPNNEIWAIPVNAIAMHRARFFAKKYYAGDAEKSLRLDTEPLFDNDVTEIEKWAKNNMDWSDVESCASLLRQQDSLYQQGWKKGYCEILG